MCTTGGWLPRPRQVAKRTANVTTEIHWHTAIKALRDMVRDGDPTRFCLQDAHDLIELAGLVKEIVRKEAAGAQPTGS